MNATTDRVTTTLGELTLDDQGREVVITTPTASVAGTLTTLEVEQEWVDITDFGTPADEQPVRVPGLQTVRVAVGEWTSLQLPLSTRVDVYR